MKLHVELLGAPGAGKTTLHAPLVRILSKQLGKAYGLDRAVQLSILRQMRSQRTIKAFLRACGYRFGRRAVKSIFPYAAEQVSAYQRFIVHRQELLRVVGAAVRRAELGRQEREWILGRLYHEFSGFQLIEEYLQADEVLVLDEGFVHRAVALFGRGPELRRDEVGEYFNAIPLPDLVCVVRADQDARERRLALRGLPFILRPQDDQSTTAERLRSITVCVDLIESELSKRGVPLLHLDNNDTPAQAIERMNVAFSTAELPQGGVSGRRPTLQAGAAGHRRCGPALTP